MANDLTDFANNYKKQLEKGYKPADYSKQYTAIGNNLTAARDAQYEAQKQQLTAQKDQLDQEYRAQRSDAYVTAKKNALANNEALASHGLARDMYGKNSSGVSELSRANQDAALLKNINSLNVGQQQATADIDRSIADAGYEKNLAVEQDLADLRIQQLAAQQQEDQFARSYNLDTYNALVSQQTSAAANDIAMKELAEQQKQNAKANALAEIALYGMVKTDAAAAALGIEKGKKLTKKQLRALGVNV